MSDDPKAPEKTTPAPVTAQPPQGAMECDDSESPALYFNFARVTGTPEEVILDFGLNPTPMGTPNKPIKVSQKLVANYYTAKRLLAALSMTIQRHESLFGVLETDINRRVKPAAR